MTTLHEAHSSDAHYFGERPDWLIVLSRNRDSDCLEQSNFESAFATLGGESDTVSVERSSHWAVGWVEYLVVDPANSKRVRRAAKLIKQLENYPVLDEEDMSRREHEQFLESWDSWGRSDFMKALCNRIRADYAGGIHDDFSDDDVIDAFQALDDDVIDQLQHDTHVNWLYESDGSINVEGLVKAADYEPLLEQAIAACSDQHKADEIAKLAATVGACKAEQDLAVRQGLTMLSGIRALMQGSI